MPAVHRVGDIDSSGDSAQTGAEGVFANGGPTLGGGVAETLGVDNIVGLSDEDARSILSGYSAELAEGNDPDINEALESFGGGSENGVSPTTGEAGIIPAPGSDAAGLGTDDGQPPIESTKPVTEWLNFLPHVSDNIEDDVWDKLYDLAKNKLKRTLTITCGYRSPAYNARVGGAKKSKHMERIAVDVLWGVSSAAGRVDMIQQAINAGFTGIGCYNNFIHLDTGPKRHWGPNGSYTGQIQQYTTVLQNNGYTIA